MLGYLLYNVFCFHGAFGLLTNSLFISIIALHHMQYIFINWFSSFNVLTVFHESAMSCLEK